MTARLPTADAAHRARSMIRYPHSPTAKPLARYGAMEGALARGLLHLNHVEPGCGCGTTDAGWRPG